MSSVRMGLRNLLKAAGSAAIDQSSRDLNALSQEIWKNPELGYKEYAAHNLLTNFLEGRGFEVQRSFAGLETAFKATFGSGRPNVCVICEYDALPEIGHACGHNLIAEAGVAAGLGLKAALECEDAPKGMVTVMGTPAEEGGGGKVKLINNGAFEGIDLAMMVHPNPRSSLAPSFLAAAVMDATFTGRAAHAAASPWEGLNALDAAVMAYCSISSLRQQMKPTWRVHCIIKEGGVKSNIIPERSVVEFMVRTPQRQELQYLVDKVTNCFHAAAKATGTKVEVLDTAPRYEDLVTNPTMARLFSDNWKEFGVDAPMLAPGSGSTDMGNVSYVIPSIHPKFEIGDGAGIHTRAFAEVTNTPEAYDRTLVVGKVMAHTGIDVLTTEGLLEEIQQDFAKST